LPGIVDLTNDECEEGRDSVRSGPGRWYGLPMHVRNRITMPRDIVEEHPAALSGAAMRAILDHFQQA